MSIFSTHTTTMGWKSRKRKKSIDKCWNQIRKWLPVRWSVPVGIILRPTWPADIDFHGRLAIYILFRPRWWACWPAAGLQCGRRTSKLSRGSNWKIKRCCSFLSFFSCWPARLGWCDRQPSEAKSGSATPIEPNPIWFRHSFHRLLLLYTTQV